MRSGRFLGNPFGGFRPQRLWKWLLRPFLDTVGRKRLLRIASALLAVLLIFFCFYQLTSLFRTEIETMLVTEDSLERAIIGEGVLFREETPLVSAYGGLTVAHTASGGRVSKDTPLVEVYESGFDDREAYLTLCDLRTRLEAAAAEQDGLSSLTSLREQVNVLMNGLLASAEAGNAISARQTAELLRVLYVRMQSLTDDNFSIDTLISEVKREEEAILSRAGERSEVLRASDGGYFFLGSDGYSQSCDPSRLEALTGAELTALSDTVRRTPVSAPQGEVGVFARSAEWHLAIPLSLPYEEISRLTVGSTYTVAFPENGGARIPMTVKRVTFGGEDEPSVVVLSTLRMPEQFSYDRLQSVRIICETISGFSIPAAAVHVLDGETGVYVLEGSVMCFCRIEILHDLGTRYLVKTRDPSPDGEFTTNTYRYVALYDAVVLSGTRLFHGRVLS